MAQCDISLDNEELEWYKLLYLDDNLLITTSNIEEIEDGERIERNWKIVTYENIAWILAKRIDTFFVNQSLWLDLSITTDIWLLRLTIKRNTEVSIEDVLQKVIKQLLNEWKIDTNNLLNYLEELISNKDNIVPGKSWSKITSNEVSKFIKKKSGTSNNNPLILEDDIDYFNIQTEYDTLLLLSMLLHIKGNIRILSYNAWILYAVSNKKLQLAPSSNIYGFNEETWEYYVDGIKILELRFDTMPYEMLRILSNADGAYISAEDIFHKLWKKQISSTAQEYIKKLKSTLIKQITIDEYTDFILVNNSRYCINKKYLGPN